MSGSYVANNGNYGACESYKITQNPDIQLNICCIMLKDAF